MKHIILLFILITGSCSSDVMFQGLNSEPSELARSIEYRIQPIGTNNVKKMRAKNKKTLPVVSPNKIVEDVLPPVPSAKKIVVKKTLPVVSLNKMVEDVLPPVPSAKKIVVKKTLPVVSLNKMVEDVLPPVPSVKKIIHNTEKPKLVLHKTVEDVLPPVPSVRKISHNTEKPKLKQNTVVKKKVIYNKKDIYNNNTPRKVDLIFVIDNSFTMRSFLKKIPNTFSGFIPALSDVDWKLMFTSNGNQKIPAFSEHVGEAMYLENNGRVLHDQSKYLTSDVHSVESIFIHTLGVHNTQAYRNNIYGSKPYALKKVCSLPPYCNSFYNQQPLESLENTFPNNPQYFRDDASVAAVIISDGGIGGKNSAKALNTNAKDVVRAFKQKWGNSKKLIVYGIIINPNTDKLCEQKHSHWITQKSIVLKKEFIKIANLTGGKTYSLCIDDYTPLAQQIVHDFSN